MVENQIELINFTFYILSGAINNMKCIFCTSVTILEQLPNSVFLLSTTAAFLIQNRIWHQLSYSFYYKCISIKN